MDRSEKLQKKYISVNGKIGEKISKFKRDRKIRYKLHKIIKACPKTEINVRSRYIRYGNYAEKEVKESVQTLVKEYGYMCYGF